ncbi:retinoic acid receptor responder protein 3-like [Parambassis ranga]|uniref:Retinoic acid receptor responder protein 3-like n=1 Tax=Parambassis ranga TaxID=210632 RepID=A0A6P7J8D5_9TELE|nr:retinoic acid receptor responder protein 3-like [Parambassis ranga]XP_028272531.1 retinoic acid receptor responder protein 3-like [Parambassis ranga]
MASSKGNKKPKPGDLIEIYDNQLFQHWAVYVGDDVVVHLVPNNVVEGVAEVKKEELGKVVKNRKWIVNNKLDSKYQHRPARAIVRDACAMVGQKMRYCLLNSNCEHFVNNLRYGKSESRQVQKGVIAGVIAFFGIVFAVALGVSIKKKLYQ